LSRPLSTLNGKRILVVEDEALIAAMVESMLRELGAVVVGPVGTIAKGLALAGSEEIDAALLDVNVRNERIDPVSEILRGRGIPILFATGYGSRAMVDAPEAAIIDKPFSQEELAGALASLLTPTG
jgi:DNA-binding response OmpR family regulator